MFRVVGVRVRDDSVLTHHIQAAYIAFEHLVHRGYLGDTATLGQRYTPCILELLSDAWPLYLLVAGQIGWDASCVTCALHIVLAAQWVDATATLSESAAQ